MAHIIWNISNYTRIKENTMKDNGSKTEFNLELVHLERIGDILFYIGTILALISTYQEEQSLINPEPASANNHSKTIALAGWIFLAAVLIFSTTSYLRFEEQKSVAPENAPISNIRNLFGSEIVTIGNFIKVIAFTLTAFGYQIKADNPLEETNS